jgi:hypothetical protein
MNHA